jgi:lycopene cyclase domain-containing protein
MRFFYFHNRVKQTALAILMAAVPFIIWDSCAAGIHWYYNKSYIVGLYLLDLPIEEWLFFITVPYACLFTWEMVAKHKKKSRHLRKYFILSTAGLSLIGSLIFMLFGKTYTGLVLAALGLVAFFDQTKGAGILNQTKTYLYIVVVMLFTLIFNGYLTGRPIVLYNDQYQLGIRIFTTPIEDFGFGLGLLLLTVTIFESLKKHSTGNR